MVIHAREDAVPCPPMRLLMMLGGGGVIVGANLLPKVATGTVVDLLVLAGSIGGGALVFASFHQSSR